MNSSGNDDGLSVKIVYCTLNGISVLVCLLATILVFYLQLHKKIVYRLSLYQVLAALAFSAVLTLDIIFIDYDQLSQVYRGLCAAVGFLDLYTGWVKLLFTAWVTVHLFAFVVFDKNLKHLEVLYVVTSLLAPVFIAIVPLITDSYNAEPLGCYISGYNGTDSTANIETFLLWNVPALVILFAASAAMVVIAITLGYRAYRTRTHEPISRSNQYHTALKQLLPLVAFPVLFFIFQFPIIVFDIYLVRGPSAILTGDVTLVASVFVPMWSLSSGITLMFHILLTRHLYKKRIHSQQSPHVPKNIDKSGKQQYSSCKSSIKLTSEIDVRSSTYFPLPSNSLDDCHD